MGFRTNFREVAMVIPLCIGIFVFTPNMVGAHCDTLDGPVVQAARLALEKGDVTPVLKWVKKDNEAEIRELFKKTLAVRGKGPEAKELADMYFFETLVRIHRAGEGAPYTGLMPGAAIEPIIAEADKSLEKGALEPLVKTVIDELTAGIHARFHRTMESKKHAEESIEAGRKFVESYVEFTHYVERLETAAKGNGLHHGESKGAAEASSHK